MDFDFLWKLIITCSFMSVSICLSIKWIVEAYLDYLQVVTGIRVMTLQQVKDHEDKQTQRGFDDDDFAS